MGKRARTHSYARTHTHIHTREQKLPRSHSNVFQARQAHVADIAITSHSRFPANCNYSRERSGGYHAGGTGGELGICGHKDWPEVECLMARYPGHLAWAGLPALTGDSLDKVMVHVLDSVKVLLIHMAVIHLH